MIAHAAAARTTSGASDSAATCSGSRPSGSCTAATPGFSGRSGRISLRARSHCWHCRHSGRPISSDGNLNKTSVCFVCFVLCVASFAKTTTKHTAKRFDTPPPHAHTRHDDGGHHDEGLTERRTKLHDQDDESTTERRERPPPPSRDTRAAPSRRGGDGTRPTRRRASRPPPWPRPDDTVEPRSASHPIRRA